MSEQQKDPGAYIGHEPELAAETIPGGIGRNDERVAGTATQSTGEGAAEKRLDSTAPPTGHRQGSRTTDDDVREAGKSA